jgi:hypothetical protein
MTSLQWFLLCATGCIISVSGFILITFSYFKNDNCYSYHYYYGCGNNCYDYNSSCFSVSNTTKLVGTIVVAIGGVLALAGCFATTTKLAGINFHIPGTNNALNVQQEERTEMPELPQAPRLEMPEIPYQSPALSRDITRRNNYNRNYQTFQAPSEPRNN